MSCVSTTTLSVVLEQTPWMSNAQRTPASLTIQQMNYHRMLKWPLNISVSTQIIQYNYYYSSNQLKIHVYRIIVGIGTKLSTTFGIWLRRVIYNFSIEHTTCGSRWSIYGVAHTHHMQLFRKQVHHRCIADDDEYIAIAGLFPID